MIAFSWDCKRLYAYVVLVLKRSKAVWKFLLSKCRILTWLEKLGCGVGGCNASWHGSHLRNLSNVQISSSSFLKQLSCEVY